MILHYNKDIRYEKKDVPVLFCKKWLMQHLANELLLTCVAEIRTLNEMKHTDSFHTGGDGEIIITIFYYNSVWVLP